MNSQFSRKPAARMTYIVALALAASTLSFAASGAWSPTGTMISARDGHTATILTNGKILAAGGTNNGVALTSAELYNPIAGTWASTGSMHVARTLAHAVLLSNGSVLVVGGCVNDCLSATTRSAELYNPTAGSLSVNQKQKAESEPTFEQPFNAGPARQERPKQKRSPLHAFGYLLSEPPPQLAIAIVGGLNWSMNSKMKRKSGR